MSAHSVGQIGLDLVLNKKDFEKQVGGIQRLAEKTGKMLASAFAVKKLVDFGAACIELGSDLEEVQNVVDVTFPAMSKRVDAFAQGAAEAFGLEPRDPFRKVKALQGAFDPAGLTFSREYYDTLGLEHTGTP